MTVHNLKRLPLLLAVMIMTASCWSANVAGPTSSATPTPAAPPPAPPRVHSSVDGVGFPRTATYFLAQQSLPPVEQLARYDLIVLDNDWANRVPRSFFDDLRARNPRVKLLAYVNVVDQAKDIGSHGYWANGYELWQLDPATKASHFPEQWLARTAAGRPVHEWQDRVMTNLTDQAPRIGGKLFVEYAVDWIVDTVWSSGLWDGIFLDVWGDHIWTADSDRWDVDRNGVDETDDQIYGPDGPWARGLAIGEKRLRAALPTAILVANGDRTLVGGRLNGRAFESFADPSQQERAADVEGYVDAASGGGMAPPPTSMTIDSDGAGPGSSAALRGARYELGATLLQNGYWAPMAGDYGRPAWFDEMDGAGRGRGYLGRPLQPNPTMDVLSTPSTTGTGAPVAGVYRRDFDNGIVIVNTTGETVTVPLERTYIRLKGTQDPVVNDGSPVTSITIAGRDARVLLR